MRHPASRDFSHVQRLCENPRDRGSENGIDSFNFFRVSSAPIHRRRFFSLPLRTVRQQLKGDQNDEDIEPLSDQLCSSCALPKASFVRATKAYLGKLRGRFRNWHSSSCLDFDGWALILICKIWHLPRAKFTVWRIRWRMKSCRPVCHEFTPLAQL